MSAKSCLSHPLFYIFLLAAMLRVAGLIWGLPASDGWDDDGFAPRNFLTALALTYKPGSFFTYPPLHAFILATLSLPVWLVALSHATSFRGTDVIQEFIKPVYMTIFAVIARFVSLAMSLAIIWCAAEMARLIANRRAGIMAALACALSVSLTYYGQVSNLDVPYLFWSMLGLLCLVKGILGHHVKRLCYGLLFAAAAVATKDQAYALFLLSVPSIVLLWFCADPWFRANFSRTMPRLFLALMGGLLLLLLVDGAITNPAGFAQRLAFLSGPASKDYAAYPSNLAGLGSLLADMADWFAKGYGVACVLLALFGIGITLAERQTQARWVAGQIPGLAILSFTLCFNFLALRSDVRFLLPQTVLGTVYIGIAADRILSPAPPWRKAGGAAMLGCLGLIALFHCSAVEQAMVFDPRYDAENWLSRHVRAGQTIEIYGQNAYLPRFPKSAIVRRIDEKPLQRRNPLPGIKEVRAAFDQVGRRNPDFILVNAWWLRHYTSRQSELGGHRSPSKAQLALFNDQEARRYFTALAAGRLGYRLAHLCAPRHTLWPEIHIHESLNESILIFERTP